MNICIRTEKENEYCYVETMIRESFWNVYKAGCDEHVMAHKLRKSNEFLAELDLVAELDGKIIGNIMCSRAKIINEENGIIDEESMIAVGPICVLPQWQKKGIGALLIEQVKLKAKAAGYKGLVLYGDPKYYHRFGFVNAEEYSITMPDGNNMDDFMVLELDVHRLDKIEGRCYESDAFEISREELSLYERNFTGKISANEVTCSKLDYSNIRQQFFDEGKEIPLKEDECTGLSIEEKMEINPCGTYCGKCEDYGVVCDGCRNRNGKPIWYDLYSKKDPCCYYTCVKKQQYHDCSQCQKVPCNMFFEYPDPNMSDEFKQMWFRLRMENFNQINCLRELSIHDSYEENVKRYKKM